MSWYSTPLVTIRISDAMKRPLSLVLIAAVTLATYDPLSSPKEPQ
jgi:hypothetical protein